MDWKNYPLYVAALVVFLAGALAGATGVATFTSLTVNGGGTAAINVTNSGGVTASTITATSTAGNAINVTGGVSAASLTIGGSGSGANYTGSIYPTASQTLGNTSFPWQSAYIKNLYFGTNFSSPLSLGGGGSVSCTGGQHVTSVTATLTAAGSLTLTGNCG
jgi:hypothetical protein